MHPCAHLHNWRVVRQELINIVISVTHPLRQSHSETHANPGCPAHPDYLSQAHSPSTTRHGAIRSNLYVCIIRPQARAGASPAVAMSPVDSASSMDYHVVPCGRAAYNGDYLEHQVIVFLDCLPVTVRPCVFLGWHFVALARGIEIAHTPQLRTVARPVPQLLSCV